MERFTDYLRFLILGCILSLAVGCSSFSSKRQVVTDVPKPFSKVSPIKKRVDVPPPPPRASRSELIIPEHPAIDGWVYRLAMEQHESTQTILRRATQYVLPFQEIFQSHGLSKELVYVALVESGFSPTACSHAKAVGMWQFIESTGRNYGLEKNAWIDERRDPYKSARAAADYLSFLFDVFNDWPLALAAYNAGENGVKRAMLESGLRSYWDLAEQGYLPNETANYVPKIFATIKIVSQPERYGFDFDPKKYKPWHETVRVPGGASLYLLGHFADVPEIVLTRYNPELFKSMTPPNLSHYDLKIPLGKKQAFLSAVNLLSQNQAFSFVQHKVGRGDTLFGVAKQHGCSVQILAGLNGMKVDERVKKGQTLQVPTQETLAMFALQKGNGLKNVFSSPGGNKPVRLAQAGARKSQYSVHQGDTLWSISQRFGVPVQKLAACNQLSEDQKLIPGEIITICPQGEDF